MAGHWWILRHLRSTAERRILTELPHQHLRENLRNFVANVSVRTRTDGIVDGALVKGAASVNAKVRRPMAGPSTSRTAHRVVGVEEPQLTNPILLAGFEASASRHRRNQELRFR